MHANVLDAEKKQSRSGPTTSVVMADDKWGKRSKSRKIKQKKEEIKGCFEVMKLKKLGS